MTKLVRLLAIGAVAILAAPADVATRILDNWAGYLPKFRKVMPTDYRKALADMACAEEQHRVAAE